MKRPSNFRFRVFHPQIKEMSEVKSIYFDEETGQLVVGLKNNYDDYITQGVRIEPHELMKSTGFVDKEGKEIFDKDIIETEDGFIVDVYWSGDRGRWEIGEHWDELYVALDGSKVIGNTVEQPDFMSNILNPDWDDQHQI